ncbi:hypothetical protein BDR04DRAFT_1109119, partial [Suillus decipiens]
MPPRKKQVSGSQGSEASTHCIWTPEDEKLMLDYITTNHARAGDGMNFPKAFWQQLVTDVPFSSKNGVPKTSEACILKWNWLRSTYTVVDKVVHFSRVEWSTEHGANIMPASESLWVDILAKIPSAKPFKTNGWEPYEQMKD